MSTFVRTPEPVGTANVALKVLSGFPYALLHYPQICSRISAENKCVIDRCDTLQVTKNVMRWRLITHKKAPGVAASGTFFIAMWYIFL